MTKKRLRMLFADYELNAAAQPVFELHYSDVDLSTEKIAMRMKGTKIRFADLPRAIYVLQRALRQGSRLLAEQEQRKTVQIRD